MKTLIILRHGEMGENCLLTKKGQSQVKKLAKKLAVFTEGDVSIIYSPTARTWQTGKIIAEVMRRKGRSVLSREDKILCPADENSVDIRGIRTLTERDDSSVLILVTHSLVLEKLSLLKSENCIILQ